MLKAMGLLGRQQGQRETHHQCEVPNLSVVGWPCPRAWHIPMVGSDRGPGHGMVLWRGHTVSPALGTATQPDFASFPSAEAPDKA